MNDRSKFFVKLAIPVHPEYDFDVDSGSTDYVPPVKLNNLLILYTNAAIELTESLTKVQRRMERVKLEQKQKQRELDRLQKTLLAKHPAPTSSTKNLLLTEAYVRLLAENDGLLAGFSALEDAVAAKDDEIDRLKAEVKNLYDTMDTIKLACTNIMTHLSFVKQEAKLLQRP